eukprot:scaffold150788_cov20-Tisochrysis_lutea.AAC.1
MRRHRQQLMSTMLMRRVWPPRVRGVSRYDGNLIEVWRWMNPSIYTTAEWPEQVLQGWETILLLPCTIIVTSTVTLIVVTALKGKLRLKSRITYVDGIPVLRNNMYDLNQGEPSVFQEVAEKKKQRKRKWVRRLRLGVLS